MKLVNIKDRNIGIEESDIVILGENQWCERAADLAAAQYRPCVLIGAKERYAATKYEPLYLDEYDETAIQEYVRFAEFVTDLNT
jgi:hypothetical protein